MRSSLRCRSPTNASRSSTSPTSTTPTRLTFVAAKDSGITDVSPAGLADKTLGAQSFDSFGKLPRGKVQATRRSSSIRRRTMPISTLLPGELMRVLADVGPTNLWLAGADGKCCGFVGEAVVQDDIIGIGIRKEDQDLKAMINKAHRRDHRRRNLREDQREILPVLDLRRDLIGALRRGDAPELILGGGLFGRGARAAQLRSRRVGR